MAKTMSGSAKMPTEMPIEILCQEPFLLAQLPVSRQELKGLATVLMEEAGRMYREGLVPVCPEKIVLALVTDRECAILNREAMGSFGPTNILSFPGSQDMPAELALSPEMLLRESLLYGQDVAEHLVRLLSHGLMHVSGFDHGEAMSRAQDRVMLAGVRFLERTE